MNDMSSVSHLKTAPAATEAEQAVLCALLRANDAYELVVDVLAEADFYTSDHRMIFRALCAIIEANKPADAITVAQWLKDRGALDGAGGIEYLVQLSDGLALPGSARHYAYLVREKSIARALLAVSTKLGDLVYAPDGRDAAKLLDEAQAMLDGVSDRSRRGRGTFRDLRDVMGELMSVLDDAMKNEQPSGVATGFVELDRILNRMSAGQFIVVGARPKVGKTSFAVNIGMHVAAALNQPVDMFSMEMTEIEVATRILSGFTNTPAGRFREHRLAGLDWNRINKALVTLSDTPFNIDATAGLSIQDIVARARVQRRRRGTAPGLIIVDYIQLSRAEGRHDNRSVELGQVTSGLKRLAKDAGCPVMALSQLNRDSSKAGKRPEMHELRDSGAIEADADAILLLHRNYVVSQNHDEMYDAEVNVAAQRNGQIGIAPLDYDPPLTRFFDQGQAPGRRRDGASAGYSAAKNGD